MKVVEEITIDNSPATTAVTMPPCSQTFIEGLANDVPKRTTTPSVGTPFLLNTSCLHNTRHAQASVHSAISPIGFKETKFIEDLWEECY